MKTISKLLPFKTFLSGFSMIAILFILGFTINKDKAIAKNNIAGLWIGTFSTNTGYAEPRGTKFYFSLSIYPDGSLLYKSGSNAGRYVYGEGTWTLEENKFKFKATTINGLSRYQQDKVSGYANLDCTKSVLSSGYTICTTANADGKWEMTKVNPGINDSEQIASTNDLVK